MLILFYCAALSLKIAVSFSHITGHESPAPVRIYIPEFSAEIHEYAMR